MKRFIKSFGLPIIALIALAHQSFATTVIIPADDDLIISARAIVRGKVLSVASSYDQQQDRIYTYVTIKVQEVLKGRINERKIVIKELGGEVGDKSMIIFGSPQFRVGEQTLVYLDTWADGSLRTHQMFLGKFNIYDDTATGQRMVVRSAPDKDTEILQRQPHTSHAHGPSTEKMELSAYLRMVRERLSATFEQSVRFEEQHYAGVPLMTEPVEHGELSQRGELQPQFVLLGNFRFFEPDTGQPVICQVKPDNAPSPETTNDMVGAMNAWSNVSGCALVIQSGGLLSACYTSTSLQGIGIVFDNCDGRNSPSSGCASILAWGGIRLTGPETKVINGTTFRRTAQGFVSFNPYASCQFSSRCNVQEIATHEIGHALGLNHSQDSSATMAAFAHFDGRCASIRQDDSDGIRFIYPGAGGGGALTITTSSLAGGTIGASYSQTFAAAGGTPPYTWSLASGSGPLPNGLTLSSTGAISGTPSAAGTFNFTVQARDAAQTTVQKSLSITISSSGQQYNSAYVSQNVPTSLTPGQSFTSTITWRNNGTASWNGFNGFQLRSKNPEGNRTWGGNIVNLSGNTIAAGEAATITFTAFAPSTAGTYDFQWQTYQDGVGYFGEPSANVRITVGSPTSPPTVTSPSPLAATQGSAFTHQLEASGGTPPYTWSIAIGSLPQGLNLNSTPGVISGTPTAAGSFAFTVQVTDSKSQTAQKAITINVSPPALAITTTSLASAMRGLSYSQPLAASGGAPPYTWSVASGSLAGGLSIANGAIIGVPTASGQFQFTVQVTDSGSRTAQKTFTLTVEAPPTLSLELAQKVEATVSSAFSYKPSASGGIAPYSWSVTFGALPAGLSLNAVSGAITGAPTQGGAFNAGITVRDQAGQAATGSVEIKVIDPASLPAITNVKYKRGKKKLTVDVVRADPNAVLIIDGETSSARINDGRFTVKKLVLAPGRHELRVDNPNNLSSQVYVLTID